MTNASVPKMKKRRLALRTFLVPVMATTATTSISSEPVMKPLVEVDRVDARLARPALCVTEAYA